MTEGVHAMGDASAWVVRWSHLLRHGSTVLDIACGQGRHMKHLSSLGYSATGVDRSAEALSVASQWGETVLADIENAPWPLMQGQQLRRFNAVVVTKYLWRPLIPVMLQSLAPGGILIYETFAAGNETVGKPSRPDFLLEPGELLRAFSSLHVIAFEDGFLESPARFVQRIVAAAPEAGPMSKLSASHSKVPSPRRFPL